MVGLHVFDGSNGSGIDIRRVYRFKLDSASQTTSLYPLIFEQVLENSCSTGSASASRTTSSPEVIASRQRRYHSGLAGALSPARFNRAALRISFAGCRCRRGFLPRPCPPAINATVSSSFIPILPKVAQWHGGAAAKLGSRRCGIRPHRNAWARPISGRAQRTLLPALQGVR